MSAFNGTPGPWGIVDRGIWDISIEADGTVAHVNNKGAWFPSNGGESISGRSHNTMLADARLIAAAPELLDALQRLNSATRRYMEERPESDAEWASDEPSVLSVVDAAIAKATGGAA